jgi:branched-subunit amino acid ABC-type transport system permease component
MSLGRYVWLTTGLALGTLLPATLWLDLEGAARGAAALGAGLATLNSVAAYALALEARRRASVNAFMLLVLGGMGARLGLMLAAVTAGLFVLHLPQAPLTVAVLAYFALFLILELVALQAKPAAAQVTADAR